MCAPVLGPQAIPDKTSTISVLFLSDLLYVFDPTQRWCTLFVVQVQTVFDQLCLTGQHPATGCLWFKHHQLQFENPFVPLDRRGCTSCWLILVSAVLGIDSVTQAEMCRAPAHTYFRVTVVVNKKYLEHTSLDHVALLKTCVCGDWHSVIGRASSIQMSSPACRHPVAT